MFELVGRGASHKLPDLDRRDLGVRPVPQLLVTDEEHGNGHAVVLWMHEAVAVHALDLAACLVVVSFLVNIGLPVRALQLFMVARPASIVPHVKTVKCREGNAESSHEPLGRGSPVQ